MGEDELQMAAATWDDAPQVRVAPPQNFVAPHPEGEESKDQENVILAYDTAMTVMMPPSTTPIASKGTPATTSQKWKTTPTFRSTGPPGYPQCPTQSSSTRLRLFKVVTFC